MDNLDSVEWTVEYFEKLNKRAEEAECPWLKVIIDKKNKMVYKDTIHQLLGIGIALEG